jgi:DNA polymerase-3 subunit beta
VDAEVEEPGRVVVSGRLLAEIARILPAEPVEVITDGPKVTVSCGDTRFTLLTLPVEDYPALPAMPPVIGTVDTDGFATAVGQVAIAASKDETLPLLTTIRFAVEGDVLTLVATDRFRMGARRLGWQPADAAADGRVVLVPAKAFAGGIKAMASSAVASIGLSTTSSGTGTMGVESDGRRLVVRLLDERPVDYLKVFPTESAGWAEVPSAPLIEAVKRVSLVAAKLTPVMLAFRAGRVRLEAGTGDEAHAVTAVDAELHGEDVAIAFNPHFLLDGLTAVDADVVRFEYTDERKPVLVTGRGKDEDAQPDFRYLVVPVRVG